MRRYRFECFGEQELRFYVPGEAQPRRRPFQPGELEQFIREVERDYSTGRNLAVLGRKLYEWLDGPQDRWLAALRRERQTVTLEVDVRPGLAYLPWELLHDGHGFLCADRARGVTPVRWMGVDAGPAPEPAPRAIRVLFEACSPIDVSPVLAFEYEEQQILDAALRSGIELVVEERGSPGGLQEQADWHGEGYFDVLHLTGHGEVRNGKPVFLMEDDLGFKVAVDAEGLVEALGGNWPRLVFLSGCHTAYSPEAGKGWSLAEALVEAGAPAVLGWARPVGDHEASRAAAALYDALARGRTLADAVIEARVSLYKSESPDWHLLRLYTDGTPAVALVTVPRLRESAAVEPVPADQEFLDGKPAGGEVCKRRDFVGRRRELQRCLRVLRAGRKEADFAEGVVIHGMGGLGKSSLAARLCERLAYSHDRAVRVGALDEKALLASLAEALPEATAALNEAELSLRARLQKVLAGLKRPLLFVFDDFEQNAELNADRTPRLDAEGRALLREAALHTLRDVLEAIHASGSKSRVLVTCRYAIVAPSLTAKLTEVPLSRFTGADLIKKLRQLDQLSPLADTEKALRERAIVLAAGNPRLLHWLDKVLADTQTDVETILTKLEARAEEFREAVLLRALLEQQTPTFRRVLARLAVLELPAEREILAATAGELELEPHLGRAVALGLVEKGTHPVDQSERFGVALVLAPLLEGELDEEGRQEAAGQAAVAWFARHWLGKPTCHEAEALEMIRLAALGGVGALAAAVCYTLASQWHQQSRYRESLTLCKTTLGVSDDYHLHYLIAESLVQLGRDGEAAEYYRSALERCPVSGGPNDAQTRAAILGRRGSLLASQGHLKEARECMEALKAMAAEEQDEQTRTGMMVLAMQVKSNIDLKEGRLSEVLVQYEEVMRLDAQLGASSEASRKAVIGGLCIAEGRLEEALECFQEALRLQEHSENLQHRATTLYGIGSVYAKQGRYEDALELFAEVVQLRDRVGDLHEKAAMLLRMAELAHQLGDRERVESLYREAAEALAECRSWTELFNLLTNLCMSEEAVKPELLAQAVSLTLRVYVPPDDLLQATLALALSVGLEHSIAPRLLAYLVVLAVTATHPQLELGLRMFEACAEAQGVATEAFEAWVEREGLNDPQRLLPALSAALEALVPEGEWLFDRTLLPELDVDRWLAENRASSGG